MRVLLLQMDLAWEDHAANRAAIRRMLDEARPPRGAFVLAPEMAETGFVPRVPESEDGAGAAFAASIARAHGIWYQHGCLHRAGDGFGRNMAVVGAPDGSIAAKYAKIHPFGYGSETLGFRGGDRICVVEAGSMRVSPFICYDLRFPEVWRLAALAGAEVFSIGANWPAKRHAAWRSLCIARAIENQAFVIACNRVGSDPSLTYSGGSIVVSPQGEVLAEATDAPCVLHAELDLAALRSWRAEFPALRDVRRRFLGRIPCAPRDSEEGAQKSH